MHAVGLALRICIGINDEFINELTQINSSSLFQTLVSKKCFAFESLCVGRG